MWQEKNNSLYKKFEFSTFEEAVKFINQVADIASTLNHHPKISNEYSSVELWLSTHSVGNKVTEKDKAFAEKVDDLFKEDSPSDLTVEVEGAKLYTDGGSRGNPGPSAIGYVIYDGQEQLLKKEGRFIGVTTNNQAEYTGLKEGLIAAKQLGIKELEVFMDSLLVVNQVKGIYKVKNNELWPPYEAVKNLAQDFDRISFSHVPRELNGVADGLVNEALDSQSELV